MEAELAAILSRLRFEEISNAYRPRSRRVLWSDGEAMRGLTVLTTHAFLRSLTLPALLVSCCLPTQKSGLAAGPGQPLGKSSGGDRRAIPTGAHVAPGRSFLVRNVRIFDGTSVIG